MAFISVSDLNVIITAGRSISSTADINSNDLLPAGINY